MWVCGVPGVGLEAEGKEPAGSGFVFPAILRVSLSLHTWQKVAVPSFGASV